MIEDFCEFIKKIGENPKEIVRYTVRDYLLLRKHVETCVKCNEIIDKVLESQPKDNVIKINPN